MLAPPSEEIFERRRPNFRNWCWEGWGIKGLIAGIPLFILGFTIQITEIIRIIFGVTHRGISNHNESFF
jgi:hypothetical protein